MPKAPQPGDLPATPLSPFITPWHLDGADPSAWPGHSLGPDT